MTSAVSVHQTSSFRSVCPPICPSESVLISPCQFLLDGDTSNPPSPATCQIPASITTQCRPLPLATAVPMLHCTSIASAITSSLIFRRKHPFSCTRKPSGRDHLTTGVPPTHTPLHLPLAPVSGEDTPALHLTWAPFFPLSSESVWFLGVPSGWPPLSGKTCAQYTRSWSRPSEQRLRSLPARAVWPQEHASRWDAAPEPR